MYINLQPASIDIWEKKYQLKDASQRPVDESIEDTYTRVARALASVENESKISFYEQQFLEALYAGAIPAGRILSNAGASNYKRAVSLINCVVSDTIPDSMDGIFAKLHEASLTLKAGCGIGYDWSTLRPKGAYVNGAGASTSGPLSFMDVYDKMCFTISSAGGRRGAQMGVLSIEHPDVLEFIKAKRENGRLRQFNLSLLVTDEFLRTLEEDGVWNFKWNGENFGTSIKAADLWDVIMKSTYDYAEPGFLLIDEINRKNPLWFMEDIRTTNPCVTGDTLTLTSKGWKRIEKLVGKYVSIWNGYEWSTVTPKITGVNQPILDIEFSDGSVLACTPHHTFVTKSGHRIKAKALKVGDALFIWSLPIIEGKRQLSRKESYVKGFLAGNSIDSDQFFTKEKDVFAVPKASYSIKSRVSWLSGLLDSEAAELEENVIEITTSRHKDFLLSVKYMLATLGLHVPLIKVDTKFKLKFNATVVEELKKLGLKTRIRVLSLQTTAEPIDDITVVSIVERSKPEETVYCFTEPNNHTGMFNGIMTGQCGEQPLPPYSACLLGSIDVTKFVTNPFSSSATFDFYAFERIVRIFNRMLDNVVELNGLPLEQQRAEILNKRRHGMGILGLGSAMAMLGMPYGSKDSVQFTSGITRFLALTSYEEGIRVGKEKGVAPIFNSVTEKKDLWNHRFKNKNFDIENAPTLIPRSLLFVASHYFDPWRDDKEGSDVLKDLAKYGSRWTHCTSIAPTGTIALSLGNNCSNGIEPSFSHSYIRNVIREGKNAKEAVNVYSYEYLLYKTMVEKGILTHLNSDEVTNRLVTEGKDPQTARFYLDPVVIADSYPQFNTSDRITPDQHLNVQAAAQVWVDSSISKTVNVPTDIKFEDFCDIYTKAIKLGLKGCTTFRFNPENFQGVLVNESDIKNTKYEFILENGDVLVVSGNEHIEYEGQVHTAANLFDAIKEGYYAKF